MKKERKEHKNKKLEIAKCNSERALQATTCGAQ